MRKVTAGFLALLLILAGCGRTGRKGDMNTKLYKARVFHSTSGRTLNYRLLSPPRTEHGKSYPLVIFLHGSGERGEDNVSQLIHGTWLFSEPANRREYPAWVLVPQCPENERWVDVDWDAPEHRTPDALSPSFQLLMELLTQMMEKNAVDRNRIYVTGLSMGGFGTWDLLVRYPDLFAAGVPVCGGGDVDMADRLVNMPVWAFHGADDPVVSPDRTRNMIKAIESAGGHPRYTEYPGIGHGSWVPAYKEADLLPWLFAQHK